MGSTARRCDYRREPPPRHSSSEAVTAADPVAAPSAPTESGSATRAPIHNIHTTSIATTTIVAGTIPGHRLGSIRSSLSRTRLPPDGASTVAKLPGDNPGRRFSIPRRIVFHVAVNEGVTAAMELA
jgi:hypothetical protein